MSKLLSTLIVIIFSITCYSQSTVFLDTIYFASGSSTIPGKTISKLESLLPELQKKNIESVSITGHADEEGSASYNLELSQLRARAVKLLLSDLIDSSKITMAFFGETKPASKLKLEFNRRVELAITISPGENTANKTVAEDRYSLERLLADLKPPLQSFCINPAKDTLIKLPEGTLLYYKANSLQVPGKCKCITLNAGEAFSQASIVLNNLHTVSDGKELVSQAMVFTEFKCDGKLLDFIPGKNMVIMTPTDTVRKDVLVYQWDSLQNGNHNWTSAGQQPGNLSFTNNNCGNWNDAVLPDDDCGGPCNLFFCGINRFVKGIGNRAQRDSTRKWKACKKRKKDYAKRLANLSKAQRTVVDSFQARLGQMPLNPEQLDSACIPFWNVLKKYGIKNTADLKRAIEDASAGFGDSAAGNRQRQGILVYYIYNVSQSGWSNIDWLSKVHSSLMVNLRAEVPAEMDGILKIVYTKRRSAVDAERKDAVFTSRYPMGESAIAMYIGVDSVSGKPVFQVTELNDKGFNGRLEPKATTAAEIAKRVKSMKTL